MLQWLQWIETFSAINPYLPGVIKFGVGALVVLGVLIPVSILATVLDSASKVAITQLLSYLKTQSSRLYDGIAPHVAFCAEIMNRFVAGNSIQYGFNPDIANAEVAKAQDAIDNIEKHGRSFPGIIESRLSPISDRYEDFEDRLQAIEGMKLDPINLLDPDYDLLEDDLVDEKKGKTTIFVFAPLALAVLVINTYLLNQFFVEIIPASATERISKTFGIYYSHIIAFIFSAIEFGSGSYVAFSEFKRDKNDNRTDVYISMAWIVFVTLALIEALIYFQLGHGKPLVTIITSDKLSLTEKIVGGWLAIIGPMIVIGLFLFGHKVTEGYLMWRSVVPLKRFKIELEDAHNKSTAADKAISNYNDQLKEAIQQLKDYRIASREAPEARLPESEFLFDLETRVSNAREVLESFSILTEGSHATIVTEVNQEEVKKVFNQMVFYAILLGISIAASTYVMIPLLEKHPELQQLPKFALILVPIFGLLAAAAIGYLWSMQFVMQIGKDIVTHPRSIFIRMVLGLSAGFLLALVIYITVVFRETPSYAALFIICGSMAIAIWIGPSLRVMLSALVTLVQLLWRAILIAVRWITASLSLAIFYVVTWIQSVLQIFAFPGRRLYEMIFT